MNTKNFVTQLLSKKEIADYTYITLFLIISTMFVVFAIRPSLAIAFALRKEAQELKKINNEYEQNIIKIIALQSQLESVRNKIYLLEEATPSKPEIKIVVNNLQTVADQSGVQLKEFTIPEIILKGELKKEGLQNIPLSLNLESEYQKLNDFINDLLLKRRLAVIKNLDINKTDVESTESAELKYGIEIENYYL